ncbi:F-box/WD repeat-containing protein 7-like isoform X1 [Asterias rubens]|uniref:F-box/WD repeat-containing protein 7-like isoform X1 n=1 Tax=Asterias rubens TaxID=7604 RepID=UPI001455C07A|nr:F-box/WD repeat-containing protein 7-like isoform X1 [Asterias rubens]
MSGRRVDINSAKVDELATLLGVGKARAEAIVERRQSINGFSSVQDLTSVPGIGNSVIDQNSNVLSCGTYTSHASSTTPSLHSNRHAAGSSSCPTIGSKASSSSLRTGTSGPKHSMSAGPSGIKPTARTPTTSFSASARRSNASPVRARTSARKSILNAAKASSIGSQGRHGKASRRQGCSAAILHKFSTPPYSGRATRRNKVSIDTEDSCSPGPGVSLRDSSRASSSSTASSSATSSSTLNKSCIKRKPSEPAEERTQKGSSPTKRLCRPHDSLNLRHLSPTSTSILPGSNSPLKFNSSRVAQYQQDNIETPRRRLSSRLQIPPNLNEWLKTFQQNWNVPEQRLALDELINHCEPTLVRHVMSIIEPQFQRDFISLLPRELALYVLSFLEPRDLLRAAQTCHYWRILCEDNLLWKEKCREAGIDEVNGKQTRRRSNSGVPRSPWKSMYLRQHQIEYNWRFADIKQPKVLKGHDDHVITCLQFNGQRIVSGSDDNTLKVWSATTGKCLRTLVGHTGGVWSSQMSNNIIISGSTDRTLKVWNADTGQCIHTLYGHTSTVRCMHLHGSKVVSGSRDATLRVWDIETGQCLHVLMGHVAAVRCVQYDGRRVVSGAYDYTVKVWNPDNEECLHTLQGHTNRVYSLQFDGVHIVSGSLDTSIRVWDAETGECKHTLMGHQSLTSGMELKDNILVSGNADSTVKIWDITSGQCLQTLQGPNKHQSAVTCLQFSKKFVITSSDDGTVKLWDLHTGEFIRNLVTLESGGSGGVVWRVRANQTKLVCAVGSRNGTEDTKLLVLDFDVDTQRL